MPTCTIPFQMTSGTLRILVPCDYVPDQAVRKSVNGDIRPPPRKDQSRLPQEPEQVATAKGDLKRRTK